MRPADARAAAALPRVLIVSTDYGPPWNEGEKNIARVLHGSLVEHGWQPSVCSRRDSTLAAGPRHTGSPWEVAGALRFWVDVARAARERRASVVHLLTSVSSALGLKCCVIKRLSGAALVLHVTGLAWPTRGYRMLLSADRVVVGGSYLRPFFPDAVSLPPLSPHLNPRIQWDARQATPSTSPRRILYLGAMEPVRGVHTLVAAAALLAARDFSLTLAWNGHGSDDYRRRIAEQVERLGLGDRVRWEGGGHDPARLYQEHDLVVIPRASEERMGFPLRLIEALSYGRPVVVSDVGEMPRVAEGCGAVFRREDAWGLASALQRLLGDAALYQQYAKQAYVRAARYEPTRTVRHLAGVYREVIGGS